MIMAQQRLADHQLGGLIDAAEAVKQAHYVCPACQAAVILKQGQQMSPHFAHHKGAECTSDTEGETKEHLLGKRQLQDFFATSKTAVVLEKVLPEIGQRADVYVATAKRPMAIEFQCSPLGGERLAARTNGYESLGIRPVWVLGHRHYHTRMSRKKAARFVNFHTRVGFYWLFWDVNQAILVIRLATGHQPQELRFRNRKAFQRWWQGPHESPTSTWTLHHQKRAANRLERQGRLGQIAPGLVNLLYQRGLNWGGVPWLVHQANLVLPQLPVAPDIWLASQLALLRSVVVGKQLSLTQWSDWNAALTPELLPLPMPLVTRSPSIGHVLFQWLVHVGLFERTGKEQLIRVAKESWYPDYQTKLTAFDNAFTD